MKNRLRQIFLSLTLTLAIAFATILPLSNAISWSSEDVQLTTDPGSDYSSAISQTSDERVWIFWHRLPELEDNEDILCRTYNGTAWSNETPLIEDSTNDINPAPLLATNGTFWLFWTSDIMGDNNYRIFYKTSPNNGTSWSDKTILTNTTYSDRRPSVMQATDGKIWVAWHSKRTENNDLYYKTYDGQSWSNDAQLTFNSAADSEPSIIQAQNGTILVFWSSYRTGSDYEIFYKTSSDNGAHWTNATQLTNRKNDWDKLPYATQTRDGKIWIFWQVGKPLQDYDIYYKTYDGSAWSSDTIFVGGSSEEILPSVFQAANKTIWVAWSSTVGSGDSDFDIWCRTSLPYTHDVGVANIVTSPTHVYREFGTQVQILVTARNYGLNTETFTVTAYHNSTQIGTQTVTDLAPNAKTTLTFIWDPSGLPYGYYIIKAETSTVSGETDTTDNTFIDSTVTLTIIGDINGDGTINSLDVSKLNVYWYDPPIIGLFGYSPDADLNQDGKIDLFDSATINLQWQKSW